MPGLKRADRDYCNYAMYTLVHGPMAWWRLFKAVNVASDSPVALKRKRKLVKKISILMYEWYL